MHTIIFLVYAAVVAIVSLQPASGDGIVHLDKLVHLLVYYIFAVLAYRSLAKKRYYTLLCLGLVAYGGLIELGQSYIPSREMSGYDLLANALGVLLGAAVVTRNKKVE